MLVNAFDNTRGIKGFGKHWFVDGWDGDDGFDGSEEMPFKTMAVAFAALSSGDTIHLRGRIQEQINAPQDIFDVTITGTPNRPRHGTADGVQQGYPAQWNPLATATATPNLTLREQGWIIENILFDAPDAAAAIKLSRTELAAAMDASHATIRNCRFVDGGTGIEDAGGHFNVKVEDCVFQSLTNGITCSSTSIAVPTQWQILNNEFLGNTSDIIISLNYSTIKGNRFHMQSAIVNTVYNSAQGDYNCVVDNYFCDDATAIGTSCTGGTNDIWMNQCNDAVKYGS